MPVKDYSIDDKLLNIAKQEFLLHGYEKTSVNKICEKAKITTGALFRRYKSKKELFLALIMPTVSFMHGLFTEHHKVLMKEQSLNCILMGSSDGKRHFVEYIYNNFDEFKLIFVCSSREVFSCLLDTFVEIETKNMIFMVKKLNPDYFENDKTLTDMAHIISTAYFNALFEIVHHEMTKDEAFIYVKHIEEFYKNGCLSIFTNKN